MRSPHFALCAPLLEFVSTLPCYLFSSLSRLARSLAHLKMAYSTTKTMKSALFYGKHDIRIEEIPIPVPQRGQVLVKVAWW